MENWGLDHPGLGRFEAYVGWHDELRQIDPSYPEPDEDDSPEALAQTEAAKKADGRLGRLAGRVRPMLRMNEQWQRQGLVITRDGRTISRHQSIGSRKAPMARSLPDGKFTSSSSATKPYFDITADPLGRHLTDIHLKTEDEVVAFEPPEDSPAARRQDAMDASPWKRVVYPLLGGLGKSGWAIVMLLLAPVITEIIATVIAWIVELLAPLVPDIDWPNISLPSIPWPDLPNINWPDIPWPSLPSIPWPDWTPPGWVVWLLDHPKVWFPIVLAVVWGVGARRNAKKSQAKKAEWAKRHEYARLAGAMRELAARETDD